MNLNYGFTMLNLELELTAQKILKLTQLSKNITA